MLSEASSGRAQRSNRGVEPRGERGRVAAERGGSRVAESFGKLGRERERGERAGVVAARGRARVRFRGARGDGGRLTRARGARPQRVERARNESAGGGAQPCSRPPSTRRYGRPQLTKREKYDPNP